MTMDAWLRSIGLEAHARTFATNGVDLDVAHTLTEADLRELGLNLGDRKRFRAAVAKLDSAARETPGITSDTRGLSGISPVAQAERRQLTILFCDLVGSTSLSQQLDPERLRELMQSYQQTCRDVIEKYDGHVAQYLGDGLMVYFGFPRAHEDDAERAVRSALEIVQAVSRIKGSALHFSPGGLGGKGTEGEGKSGSKLQVRIGIATGPVVVGETGAGDASVPKLAVGETPNLAARLQGVAGVDEIVIGLSTHRLLGTSFEFFDLGAITLKGIIEPVHAYRVLGFGGAVSRFDAATGGRLTPLVGRELEIGLLLDRWLRSREGEGQVVLLSGEPGIGKSRILSALHDRLGEELETTLRFQCSPYYSNSAFYPTIQTLERELKFGREESASSKLDKLEARMSRHYALPLSDVRFIASVLSIPCEDRYGPISMTPQRFKEESVRCLVDLTEASARKCPTLMLFEDAHWADPTSLEVLDLLIDRVKDVPVVILITHRPEFQPKWISHGHVSALALSRLTKTQASAMVSRITQGKALPQDLLDRIIAKTDGVPLFVEELTKAILESGNLKMISDRYEYVNPATQVAIPTTLRDSLMARLDRHALVREVAQIGAVIGREFSYDLISAVAPMSESNLNTALHQLTESGLAFRRGNIPEATYSFKHALVQDAAYDSLLNTRRQDLHGKIARVLQDQFAETVKAQPELLALHLTKAGLIDAAIPQWIVAAQSAAAASRYQEALSHVEQGLAIVDRIAADHRANLEVTLLVTGGFCQFATAGYASIPAAQMFARVEALLDQITDEDLLFRASWGVGMHAWVLANYPKTLAIFERLAALAEQTGDVDRLLFANVGLGAVLRHVAQLERSRALLESVVEHYDKEKHFRFVNTLGQDAKTIAYVWLSLTSLESGCLDQGRQYARLGIDHSKAISHPLSLALATGMISSMLAEIAESEDALDLCRQCIEVCETQSLPFFKGWAMVSEGVVSIHNGRYEFARERLTQAVQHLESTGARSAEGYIRAYQAIALAHLGRFEEARREIAKGRKDCEDTGDVFYLSLLAYGRGVTETLDPSAEEVVAEEWFSTALSETRKYPNRLIELRTACALARLWQSQGKRNGAYDLLAPIYNGFTEGFDTKDLKEAKALLDQLS